MMNMIIGLAGPLEAPRELLPFQPLVGRGGEAVQLDKDFHSYSENILNMCMEVEPLIYKNTIISCVKKGQRVPCPTRKPWACPRLIH